MFGNKARAYHDAEAKKRQQEHSGTAPGKTSDNTGGKVSTSDKAKARDQAGKAVGVSGRTIDKAAKVTKYGTPALVKAVESDKIGVSAAEKIAKLPNEQQDTIIEDAERNSWTDRSASC